MPRFVTALTILGTIAATAALATIPDSNGHRERVDEAQSRGLRVHAIFNLNTTDAGPFPSNWFTVADSSQKTGLSVNLPKPDCSEQASDCEDIDVINTLDGFNLLPRLSLPLDGPIDPTTVTSRSVVLVNLQHDGDDSVHAVAGGWTAEKTIIATRSPAR